MRCKISSHAVSMADGVGLKTGSPIWGDARSPISVWQTGLVL